jgi:hypothetical protein
VERPKNLLLGHRKILRFAQNDTDGDSHFYRRTAARDFCSGQGLCARLLMLGILLGAWAWRLAGLTSQSLWRDEVDSLRFATRPLPEVLAAFTRPGENGPLFYLLLRPWLALAGHSEFALRFPSVLMGVLAIPLIFQEPPQQNVKKKRLKPQKRESHSKKKSFVKLYQDRWMNLKE